MRPRDCEWLMWKGTIVYLAKVGEFGVRSAVYTKTWALGLELVQEGGRHFRRGLGNT